MENNILLFIAVGFIAQMIDGALGMAYGVSSTSFLLSLGVPPAAASASVHLAEVFTTGASGISHWRFGNVDKKLVKTLLLPGVLGGVTGAYILTVTPSDIIKPLIAVYLLVIGITILLKVVRTGKNSPSPLSPAKISLLGLIGGFFDATGGGGWGPIVTTTLVFKGNHPRYTIGSVNLSEFAVTLSQSITFTMLLGITHWQVVIGLLIGGVVAAPFGAYTTKKLPVRALTGLLGILITVLSIRTIWLAFN